MSKLHELEDAVSQATTFNELLSHYIWHNTEGLGAESQMSKSEAADFNAGLFSLQRDVVKRLRAVTEDLFKEAAARDALTDEPWEKKRDRVMARLAKQPTASA
jgi:hypothetical protein